MITITEAIQAIDPFAQVIAFPEATYDDVVWHSSPLPKADVEAMQVTLEAQAPAKAEIKRIEQSVTPRRMREAITSDEGKAWVANIEDKIESERAKL
tara:strand:+ start:147 stop:437 length:291 start_codon:yes stop_codon:yes gene_type:complete